MGLGPPILALYHQMKRLGAFDGITDVIELGSQGVWCPDPRLLEGLFEAFDKPMPSDNEIAPYINSTGTGVAASRHLHEKLGFRYECLDVDANFGALTLDLNFDQVPPDFRNRYGLTTNHGTTEHILNQYNCFKIMHDLTKQGGLMLHAVTFTVHLEHGFFNYQPRFFNALARSNAYETLGVWVGPDWQLTSLVPWDPSLVDYLSLSSKTTNLLVVLQRKTSSAEFRAPPPGSAQDWAGDGAFSPYCNVVFDGDVYEGARNRFVTRSAATTALAEAGGLPAARPRVRKPAGPSRAPEAQPLVPADFAGAPVGPGMLSLYRQMKTLGQLDRVESVIELGSRKLENIPKGLTEDLLRAFGREDAVAEVSARIAAGELTTRELHRTLGLKCTTVAAANGADMLQLDLNVDTVPASLKRRFDLATNIGTSEFLLNQLNAFQSMHDLTRPGGLMLHIVPFTVQLEKTFFGYQPNLFDALARYNSYRTLGFWLGVDSRAPGLIPWHPQLLDYLVLNAKTTHVLIVLLEKMYSNEFCVPFQGVYEPMIAKEYLARYRMVIDGTDVDAATTRELGEAQPPVRAPLIVQTQVAQELNAVSGRELVSELGRRIKWRGLSLASGRFRDALQKPVDSRRP